MIVEIVETPDDPKPFKVVVSEDALILLSNPVDSYLEAQNIVLIITTGARIPGGVKALDPGK